MLGKGISNYEIQSFREEISKSSEKRRHIRIIGVGEEGVGKSTLCRRLLRQDFTDVQKTRSIETHIYTAVIEELDDVESNIAVQKLHGM